MHVVLFTLILVMTSPTLAKELNPKNPMNAPGKLYWCPNKTADQQYSSTPMPGCSPLVDEDNPGQEKRTDRQKTNIKRSDDIKIDNIQTEASKFVRQYNAF